jgi:predicted O-methyltransferase YrrM
MDSIEASKQYEDESLDFVFIDASHEYEFVKADILTWLPKVKKGGWIGGHDFTPNDPPTNGVDTAVKEIFGDDYGVDHVSWLHHKA